MAEDFVTRIEPLPGEVQDAPQAEKPAENGSALSQTPRNIEQTPRDIELSALPEIDNTNKHFKGQQKNEIVHCFCRKHWIVLLPHLLGIFSALAILLLFISINHSYIADLIGGPLYVAATWFFLLGLTYYFHYFFIRIFNYYLQILIITNFRIIHLDQTLYFHRNRDSIDLPEIQDIEIQQNGLLKTLLNYGELIITLSSAHASKTIYCIPNPEYHFRKINKTKREYITLRRLQKTGAV